MSFLCHFYYFFVTLYYFYYFFPTFFFPFPFFFPFLGDKTGTHSVYTTWHNHEIMYHVANLIPFNPSDPQQLERKRQIGNDIVIVAFCDEPNVINSIEVFRSHQNRASSFDILLVILYICLSFADCYYLSFCYHFWLFISHIWLFIYHYWLYIIIFDYLSINYFYFIIDILISYLTINLSYLLLLLIIFHIYPSYTDYLSIIY